MTADEKDALLKKIDALQDVIMKDAQKAVEPITQGLTEPYRKMWLDWLEKRRLLGSELEQLKQTVKNSGTC